MGALPRPDSEEAVVRELERAVAAFRALARVHAAGVVHRAIGPETVYVDERDGDPAVVFTDLFAARRGEATIAPRLDELRLQDPYVAPEIALVESYGFAGPASDTYSLALVFLERFSGAPVAKLVREDGSVAVPKADEGWDFLPQEAVDGIVACFRRALTRGPAAPAGSADAERLDAEGCAEGFEAVVRRLRADEGVVQGDLLDGRYRVERVLGTGASARTLLAHDTEADGLFALKQFLRPAAIAESKEARREFEVLRTYPHPRLPRVFDVYPMTAEVHVKLEYVDGVPLTAALPAYAADADLDRWRRLASDLLDAVEHLEQHQLLHRDIKPDNVLVRDGTGEAVLIDFGAATAVGANLDPVGTPLYLPPEAYTADVPPPSADRYALGVLLFRALAGRMPFVDDGNPLAQQVLDSVDVLPEPARPFARVLLQAVAQDPAERYPTAAAFREALLAQTGPEERPEDAALDNRINPTVDLLRGLFRNSAHGNADNRGLDSAFARATYVPTALDERLLPTILADRPRAVFLSGNPGDGKTAFLERFREALRERGGEEVEADPSGWAWRLNGHTYRACYDASEAHAGRSADDQLRGRLEGLGGDHLPCADISVLVAINDGRLADVAEKFAGEFGWLTDKIERAADPAAAPTAGGVWVIDLKRRAYVASGGGTAPSVMGRVLATLTAPERWAVCEECAARTVCPIRRNAVALGAEAGAVAPNRLEHLLLLSHLRGQRHITMRDLRSGLAYLVTGDLGCGDVHGARNGGEPLPAREYWRSAFATESGTDVMLGELTALDPGRLAQPQLERFFFFHQSPGETSLRASRFADGHDLPPMVDGAEWLALVKRRLYFESRAGDGMEAGNAPAINWLALLPYRHGGAFAAAMARERSAAELLPTVARGIGRSDGLSGGVLDDFLCLRVAYSEANRLTVLKRFPLAEFALSLQRPTSGGVVESMPRALLLTHARSRAQIEITLDLFEMLARLAEGLEPGSPELQPLMEDLAPFKSAVQLSNTKDLILIEGGRRTHTLTQRDGKVVRESVT